MEKVFRHFITILCITTDLVKERSNSRLLLLIVVEGNCVPIPIQILWSLCSMLRLNHYPPFSTSLVFVCIVFLKYGHTVINLNRKYTFGPFRSLQKTQRETCRNFNQPMIMDSMPQLFSWFRLFDTLSRIVLHLLYHSQVIYNHYY